MSDKPVAERLQVKVARRLAVIGASAAPEKTVGAAKARADLAKADVVLLFAPDRAGLGKAEGELFEQRLGCVRAARM